MNWIAVSDKLPELGDKVLVLTDEDDLMSQAEYIIDRILPDRGPMFDMVWFSHFGCGCCGDDQPKITHWMPLPEMPSKECLYPVVGPTLELFDL